jgi:hypothetical protein
MRRKQLPHRGRRAEPKPHVSARRRSSCLGHHDGVVQAMHRLFHSSTTAAGEDIPMPRQPVVPALSPIDAGRVAKRAQTLLLGAVIAAMFGGAAAAQSAARPNEAVKQACADDVHRLCAGIPSGGGGVRQCVIENREQLSDGCKSAMQAARNMTGR